MSRLIPFLALTGLMVVEASFIIGFRFDPMAPAMNYVFNLILFVIWMAVHVVMLLPWFKNMVYGQSHSSSRERRIYVAVSIVTWLLLYMVHLPVPGPGFAAPVWMQYIGVCVVLVGILMFFEGTTVQFLHSFLGVSGEELAMSTDSVTPLMTEGSYASVRHPMYRGAITFSFASLLIHPHAGQFLFALLVSLGFVLFIPFEERALVKARGDEYVAYMKEVKYRVIRGIW